MKLSEAIRLGSLLKRQAFHYLFNTDTSCALGAALEACGIVYCPGLPSEYYHHKLEDLWPWATNSQDTLYFEEEGCKGLMVEVIIYLNNHRGWTRERIADWVETVEPEDGQTCASPEHTTNPERTPA